MLPSLRDRLRPLPSDERLLRLFWNRAELKREFAKLQRERDRMLEHLRQQEGQALRLQQRLEQLEGLLSDPLRAASVAVYFQLRAVWQHCRRRLARLAQDLAARQQDIERARDAARFRDNRAAALAAIDQRITGLEERREALRGELAGLAGRRAELGAPWRYFERRALEADAVALDGAIESLDAQVERYARVRAEKAAERGAAGDGLGVDSRRVVNVAVIALAQELCLHFAAHDIVGLARDAATLGVTDVGYGGLAECRRLAERVESAMAALERIDDLPARVRRRAAWLRREAAYGSDADTIPGPGAFDSIPVAILPEPEAVPAGDRAVGLNVLADDYWDIYGVLLT
jgi:hypothetical protein